MIRPPPHKFGTCIGLDLNGIIEPCGKPLEVGSALPFCEEHRLKILAMPRRRTCAGAVTYDNAMRPTRAACSNLTGHEEEPLCATCRVLEKRERERFRNQATMPCPHCGQQMPRMARFGQPPSTGVGRRIPSTIPKAFPEEPSSGERLNVRRSDRPPTGTPSPPSVLPFVPRYVADDEE